MVHLSLVGWLVKCCCHRVRWERSLGWYQVAGEATWGDVCSRRLEEVRKALDTVTTAELWPRGSTFSAAPEPVLFVTEAGYQVSAVCLCSQDGRFFCFKDFNLDNFPRLSRDRRRHHSEAGGCGYSLGLATVWLSVGRWLVHCPPQHWADSLGSPGLALSKPK